MEIEPKTQAYIKRQLIKRFATEVVVEDGSGRLQKRSVASELPKVEEALEIVRRLYSSPVNSGRYRLPLAESEMARFGELVFNANFREQGFSVVSPCCPDYKTQNNGLSYRSNLGEGISSVGEELLKVAPPFVELLKRVGIKEIDYLILMADVEVEDEVVVKRMGLDREEFLRKVSGTAVQVNRELKASILDSQVMMMSRFLEPADYLRAKNLLKGMKESRVKKIAETHAGLYGQWFDNQEGMGFNDFAVDRARSDAFKALTFGSATRRAGVCILEVTDYLTASLYNYADGLPLIPLVMASGT